jgi:hypothetical protein
MNRPSIISIRPSTLRSACGHYLPARYSLASEYFRKCMRSPTCNEGELGKIGTLLDIQRSNQNRSPDREESKRENGVDLSWEITRGRRMENTLKRIHRFPPIGHHLPELSQMEEIDLSDQTMQMITILHICQIQYNAIQYKSTCLGKAL